MSISVSPFDVSAYSSNAKANDVVIGANEADATTIWDLDQIKIDPACALRVPKHFAQRKKLLPLCRVHEKVVVAGTGPIDASTSRSLRNLLKSDFEVIQSTDASLRRALSRTYDRAALPESRPDEALPSTLRTSSNQSDRNVAEQLSDEVIRAAILRNASDIHLIPGSSHSTIRLRVDGELETYREIPQSDHEPLLNRLKVLAGMDVTERRVAQDGRITVKSDNGRRKLELRAACIPTRFGQRMTLRLLNLGRTDVSLNSLGMVNEQVLAVEEVLRKSHGLVLITGPTGSGKSTTLLAAIETWMKQVGGNVLTIEDPIEYEIEGASQVEVDSADKVTFEKALRSMLRHDPDLLMIGEIRDSDTASVAVQAALTGHLVFSTLHTATAAGAALRMLDLGVDRFLLNETLRLVVSQRLVRRLCEHCRRPRPLSAEESGLLRRPELTGLTVFEPQGCLRCSGKGTVGRTGLFELMTVTELRSTMAGTEQSQAGRVTLLDDAVQKLIAGEIFFADAIAAAGGQP